MPEREFALIRSYYSETATRLQEKVEEECNLLDFEGSRIYDEHPDQMMLKKLCDKIMRSDTELAAAGCSCKRDLIEVLLLQEILRRRCRNKECM